MCSNGKTKSYNFLSEPNACLLCSICLELTSQPKQCEDCGKLFCSECIEKNGRKPCPNCRTDNPKYFRDARSKLIAKLFVHCITNVLSFRQERDQFITSEMCQL